MSRRRRVLPGVAALLLAGCSGGGDQSASPIESAAPGCHRATQLRIHARVRVGPGAGPLAVAGDTLWTARPAAGVLVPVRVGAKPRAGRPVRVGGAPVSLAAGFGSVWVADRDRGRILRVDSVTGAAARWADVQAPIKIVVAQEKLFAISLDDGALYALNPQTQGAGVEIAIPALAPVDAVYQAGDVWVLGGRDGDVSPFNVRLSGFVRGGVKLPVRVVGGITAGQGAVWAALPTARSVVRLDPSTLSLTRLRTSRGFRPTAVAVDDCTVWVGDADGRVERVDADSARHLGRPVRIGRALATLVADRGGVWASDPRDGTVVRVAPRP